MEFKEMTKLDALVTLNSELTKLRKTSNLTQERNTIVDKEFEAFQRLFSKFLEADASKSIDWDKIEKLPEGSILSYDGLSK